MHLTAPLDLSVEVIFSALLLLFFPATFQEWLNHTMGEDIVNNEGPFFCSCSKFGGYESAIRVYALVLYKAQELQFSKAQRLSLWEIA